MAVALPDGRARKKKNWSLLFWVLYAIVAVLSPTAWLERQWFGLCPDLTGMNLMCLGLLLNTAVISAVYFLYVRKFRWRWDVMTGGGLVSGAIAVLAELLFPTLF